MQASSTGEVVGEFTLACPTQLGEHSEILLAHGGGGKLMHTLIERMFLPAFANSMLDERHDGAVLPVGNARLAFTTDSHVVSPLFFPGGDIGTLAVNGTVNDLAMCGARPLYLSVGFILEEGLPVATLGRVVQSMKAAAVEAGVQIVTGDTKVVDRGKGDGIYISTAGVGLIEHDIQIDPSQVRPGDVILLSGDIGRHGIAVMSVRNGLEFESSIESDCASVSSIVLGLIEAGIEVHCMRDLTRGGLASALVEIAEASRLRITLEESAIPLDEAVQGACELLGLDPLHVANEGRFIAFVAPQDAERALDIMRLYPVGQNAAAIGAVNTSMSPCAYGQVMMRSMIGVDRIVNMLSGEQLPRIC